MRSSTDGSEIHHPLKAGCRVLIDRKLKQALAGAVLSVNPGQVHLQFSEPLGDSFESEEEVRIQYWQEKTVYCWNARVLNPTQSEESVILSLSDEGLTVQGRKCLRINLAIPFSFVVTEASQDSLIGQEIEECITENVSVGGLKFETSLPLISGDKLALTLHLSPTNQVDACGWVVRSKAMEEEDTDLKSVALEFFQFEEDDQKRLLQFMAKATQES